MMGVVLIILFIVFVLNILGKRHKKKNRTIWHGKSNWEKECDDGGKFFGW